MTSTTGSVTCAPSARSQRDADALGDVQCFVKWKLGLSPQCPCLPVPTPLDWATNLLSLSGFVLMLSRAANGSTMLRNCAHQYCACACACMCACMQMSRGRPVCDSDTQSH